VRAIEFFSGIGAFAEATRNCEIEVVAAFDQNSAANSVYAHNFSLQPYSRNLDTIKLDDIPPADLWWLSPPCTPFSVRGKQRGLNDPRAVSFLNLITLARTATPQYVLIENVLGFRDSPALDQAKLKLEPLGYYFIQHNLCSTQFGVPMRRPRHFVVACRRAGARERVTLGNADLQPAFEHASGNAAFEHQMPPGWRRSQAGSASGTADLRPAFEHAPGSAGFQPASSGSSPNPERKMQLRDFLSDDSDDLFLPNEVMSRYERGFDIVDPSEPEAELICFTKNYERCMRASGSLIRTKSGTRRVSPEEILKLLGFSDRFCFPDQISRSLRWRLVGNSVDVRAIKFILSSIGVIASEKALVER